MFRIFTNNPHYALAYYDFALGTHFLNSGSNFHTITLTALLMAICYSPLTKIVWGHFNGNLVAWKNFDIVHAHLA